MKKISKLFLSCFAIILGLLILVSCDVSTNNKDNNANDTSINNTNDTTEPIKSDIPTEPDSTLNPDTSSEIDPITKIDESAASTDENIFYTITFKDDDGRVLQSSNVKKGEMPTYNKSNPTKVSDDKYSYIFNDWNPVLTKAMEDTIYTATYTKKDLPYAVVIDLNGGTSRLTKLNFKTDKISKDMFPFDVVKKGYVFKGYELNGKRIFDGSGNLINDYQLSSNMTFKAIYEESVKLTITYSLYNPKTNKKIQTFNEKPSDMGDVSETRTYNWNTPVDLVAKPNEGYTFVGWYHNGLSLSNEENYNYMMWEEDVTLDARFEYTKYDLELWSNNQDLGQVMIKQGNSQIWYNEQTQKQYYTESTTIAAYTKTDIRFLGWYDENNNLVSTSAVYTFNMPNRNYKLEAKWNYFNITYELDGGINNLNNPTFYNKDMNNITLSNPNKPGYTFKGWEYNGNIIDEIETANVCHMKIKAIWTYYTLTTNVNNNKAGTITSYESAKIIEGEEVTIKATTKSGYTFDGWYDGNTLVTKKLEYTFNMPSKNLSYTAKWTTNTDTPYRVEHYLQNIDDANYPTTPHEIDNLTGTTDTLSKGKVKTYEGFTSPTITQVNINGDGSTVIRLYYTRNSYSITLSRNNNNAGSVTGASTYKYGKNITIKATTKSGYMFDGWYDGNNKISNKETYTFNMLSKNLNYTAKWTANKNTPYKVEHYKQNYEDDKYTFYEAESLTGTTNELTAAKSKSYVGYKEPTISQKTINGDGSTVVKIYYQYITYSLTLNRNNNSAGTVSGNGNYKINKEVTIKATTKSGYTFDGWYDGNTLVTKKLEYTFNMPSKNLSYTAKWTTNTDTPYRVEHYLQNIDDANYPTTPHEIDNLTGTTDTLSKGKVKTYEGFTSPTITQVNINGDGSTVIRLYYTRNSYSITLSRNNNNAGSVTGASTYKYGKKITIKANTYTGYTFDGWYDGNNKVSTKETYTFNMAAKNLNYTAKWTANKYKITIVNSTKYTVSGITSGNEYEVGTKITLTLKNNSGIIIIGSDYDFRWIRSDEKLYPEYHFGISYTFTVPAEDLTINVVLMKVR